MLLTENEIKLANSNKIIESDAGDVATVQNKLGDTAKRKQNVCPECGKEKCICKETPVDENSELEEIPDVTDETRAQVQAEVLEVLNELDPDELEFVKMVIEENLPDFCPEFIAYWNKPHPNNDTLLKQLINISQNCCNQDLQLLTECVFYVLSEIDDFTDFAYDDTNGYSTTLGERLINPAHIRRLKLLKKKSQWKMDARKRARFRRTGEGRILKRKAKLYQKRYRRRKKQRLKRYGKEYAKFKKTHS